MIRADFIFSYWILLWFIIYYIRIHFSRKRKTIENFIKYGNPLFAFYCAFFENLCVLIYLFVKDANWYILIKYIFNIFVLKIIPIYLLQSYKMNLPNDFYMTSALGIIYLIYLSFFGETFWNIYGKIGESILLDKNETPLEYLFFY